MGGLGSVRFMVGLDDLKDLFQPKKFYDSVYFDWILGYIFKNTALWILAFFLFFFYLADVVILIFHLEGEP